MTGSGEGQQPELRIVRARQGRLVGGVCAGLPDVWGLGTNGLRLIFIIAAFLGGIGIVAYLTCWLVIPAADQDPDADPVRDVVLLAWATGGLVLLVLVAAAAAAATVFGLGWVVFGLAAIVAGLSFSPLRTRIPSIALLLTLGALTLPAVAVALSPLRLTLQSGQSIVRSKLYRDLSQTVYHSGFGTLLIDLRRTPVPASGNTTVRIDAGLRRTIVALPANECVRVRVNYDIHLFPAHLAALLTGRAATAFHDVMLFGRPFGYGAALGTQGTATDKGTSSSSGPWLTIDFTSQGGGLYVRDYPNDVSPEVTPQWPGFSVTLESAPNLHDEPKKVQKQMVHDYHERLQRERGSQRFVNSKMPGPCAG
jgi:phage shock protein PspC (stress-responsive transcriptional regulator)